MAVKNNNGTSSPKQLFIASCVIFFIVAVGSVGKIDARTICTTGKVVEGYRSQFAGHLACSPHCWCYHGDCYCKVCPPGEGASKTIDTEKLKRVALSKR